MATNIRLKSSSVTGKTPTLSDLSLRELAVNTVDGKLFLRKGTEIGTDTIVDLTNHSTFSNLANDDHTQYIHATTTRIGVTAEFNTTGKITTTNRIGIGTTDPASSLHVITNTVQFGYLVRGQNIGTGSLENLLETDKGICTWGLNSTLGGAMLATAGAGDLVFNVRTGGNIVFSADIQYQEQHLVITEPGNVGIGTNNPAYKLHVIGDINFTGTLNQNGSPFVTSRWTAGTGDNIYRLSGNVGIGTTNPTQKLDVIGNIQSSGTVRVFSSFGNRYNYIRGDSSNDYGAIGARTSTDTVNTDALVWTPNANVGIGTTNPTSKLHVSGGDLHVNSLDDDDVDIKLGVHASNSNFSVIRSIRASNLQSILSFNVSNNGLKEVAQFHYDEGLYVKGMGDGLSAGNAGLITFSDQSGVRLAQITSYKTGVNNETDLIFATKGAGQGVPERLRITASGNVGVGTDNPQAKLHLIGNGLFENVGGFTAPNTDNFSTVPIVAKLTSPTGDTFFGALNAYSYPCFAVNVSTYTDSSTNRGIVRFYDKTDGNWNNSIVLNTGKVGIGITNPGSILAVNGYITENPGDGTYWNVVTQKDIGFNANQVPLNQYLGQLAFADTYSPSGLRRDGGGSDDVVVNSSGFVGIGTTNPTFELQVGSGNFGNVAGQSGVAITASSQIFNTFGIGGDLVLRAQRPSDVGGGSITLGGSGRGDWRPDSVMISTANTPRVFVSTTGNVGIGITNPTTKFDVIGNARIGGAAVRSASGLTVGFTNNNTFAINTDVNDQVRTLSIINESATTNAMSVLAFRVNPDGGTANAMLDMKFVQTGATNTSALHYTFNHNNSFVDRLTILSSGNVGIGTTAPGALLHVQGTILTAGSYETGNNLFGQGAASITGGTAATINQLSSSIYRSVEYTIQAVQGANYHVTKILAIHDGTNVNITEYGTIITNTSVATYSIDISGGNIVVTATPASASTTTFKIAIIGLKV